MSTEDLPHAITLAWGLADKTRPGPKPRLSPAKVVDAAIELADRDGLARLSLSTLASELGTATASLYRYFSSKEELLLLMRDTVAAGPDDPAPTDPANWRAGLNAIAWHIFDRYRAHPWVLEITVVGPPTMPNELRWAERILAVLAATSLSDTHRLRTVAVVSGYVREQARLALDPVISQSQRGVEYADLLGRLLTPDRFPMFCRVFADQLAEAPVGYDDEDFQFGLDLILDGLAKLDADPGARTRP